MSQIPISPSLSVSTTTTPSSGSAARFSITSSSTDTDVIATLRKTTEDFFLGQADTAIKSGIPYGAFIILTASIHFLAGAMQGANQQINGHEFKAYCTTYLPTYDAEQLWKGLRNGLFHRGTPNPNNIVATVDNIVLVAGQSDKHDTNGAKGIFTHCVTLNAEDFLIDIRKSSEDFWADALKNPDLMNKCRSVHDVSRPIKF